eukprot:COSAG06_NODE_20349_length_798_cov_8041.254649_1_plen_81_part_00
MVVRVEVDPAVVGVAQHSRLAQRLEELARWHVPWVADEHARLANHLREHATEKSLGVIFVWLCWRSRLRGRKPTRMHACV